MPAAGLHHRGWPAARQRGAVTLLSVVALHLGIAWLLRDATAPLGRRDTHPAAMQRVTLRLIPFTAEPARTQNDAPRAPDRRVPALATAAAPALRAAGTPRSITLPQAPTSESAAALPPLNTVSQAEPSASAPPALPSLLDTEATRRAIRASAREPSLIGQVARAGTEPRPPGAQERLGNDMKAAGTGDCLKGDYPGAGMGLLSLPFLAVAAARGTCAQ